MLAVGRLTEFCDLPDLSDEEASKFLGKNIEESLSLLDNSHVDGEDDLYSYFETGQLANKNLLRSRHALEESLICPRRGVQHPLTFVISKATALHCAPEMDFLR